MNKEHYKRLTDSVEHFNAWRESHWEIKPDLSFADLRNKNLFGARLDDATLEGADLRGATLINVEARAANFHKANLSGASLQGANLSYGDFTGANMTNTNLMGTLLNGAICQDVDFVGSDLTGARLENANLYGADLTNVNVKGTVFNGANLKDARFFYEDFKEANIPLEQISILEKKTNSMRQIILFLVWFIVLGSLVYMCYQWVSSAKTPNTLPGIIKANIYYISASQHYSNKRYKEGKELMIEAVRLSPDSSGMLKLLADCHRKLDEPDQAIKYYKMYIKLEPQTEYRENIKTYILEHGASWRD